MRGTVSPTWAPSRPTAGHESTCPCSKATVGVVEQPALHLQEQDDEEEDDVDPHLAALACWPP